MDDIEEMNAAWECDDGVFCVECGIRIEECEEWACHTVHGPMCSSCRLNELADQEMNKCSTKSTR